MACCHTVRTLICATVSYAPLLKTSSVQTICYIQHSCFSTETLIKLLIYLHTYYTYHKRVTVVTILSVLSPLFSLVFVTFLTVVQQFITNKMSGNGMKTESGNPADPKNVQDLTEFVRFFSI